MNLPCTHIPPQEPTCFASCLSKVYRAGSGSKSAYQIALIVTDGGCDDMEATVDMIVDSSTEPISIIIVGVGEGPWENMDFLSADDEPLQSKRTKKMMKRDIVGFVEMNKYSTRESVWDKHFEVATLLFVSMFFFCSHTVLLGTELMISQRKNLSSRFFESFPLTQLTRCATHPG